MKISNWRIFAYALIVMLGCITAFTNLLPSAVIERVPALPHLRLGLDLRGGSLLVLEIDDKALKRDEIDGMAQLARQVLSGARLTGASAAIAGRQINVTLARPEDSTRAMEVLSEAIPTVAVNGFGRQKPIFTIASETDRLLVMSLSEEGLLARRNSAVDQSVEIVRRRIDETGVAEPLIQRLGPGRIMVQLPGVQDSGEIRKLLGSTAKLSFHRVETMASADGIPQGYHAMQSSDGQERYIVERAALIQGDNLADASAGFDQATSQPIVHFRFDRRGSRRFAEISTEMVGLPFAIVLDGKVLSAPVIQEPILGGSGQISGNFTVQEASTLAALLRAGALPAPLEVIEERTVGPGLGKDAIDMGIWTGLTGFALVCAVMVFLYGVWGLAASAALAINVLLVIAALSLIGATLTLPGIAGIILGLGMAVDANVLINERIREETRKGRGAVLALQAGFERAYRAIVDANVTTLIATGLLFWFGSGPVRGFALTMGLGIGISMFTALSVVNSIMATYIRTKRPKVFAIEPLVRLSNRNWAPSFRFMRGRFIGLVVSLVLSVGSIVLFVYPGLNYGIDFQGGIVIEARTDRPVDLVDMRTALAKLGLGEVNLQQVGGEGAVMVRIERQPGSEAQQGVAAEAAKGAIRQVEPDAQIVRVDVIGPRVSGELAQTGIIAVVLACMAMFAYFWFRFEWPFAVGAIATLVLDVTKTVGFFSLTGLDFGLTAIAALLTLIGYSVNDKVVVYDRMRENMRLYKKMPLRDLIDLSINQTLARSIFTSLTTVVAMLPMAIAGGSTVHSFAIPMVFGIIIATSSSIFIAAPILLFLGDWRTRRKLPPAPLPVPVRPNIAVDG